LWLLDGKRVELGLWREIADVFVGSDIDYAITTLRELQAEMDIRYALLEARSAARSPEMIRWMSSWP
jgi:DNA segregation ATPase FtsK/SpoIIIE, S-DNA-T family